MLTFRTRPGPGTQSPTKAEMRTIANKIGLKTFSPSLVADFCHLAEGGRVLPPSSYREIVWQQAQKKYEGQTPPGRFGNRPPSTPVEDLFDQQMKYHQRVIDFVRSIKLDRFPGHSPLEKAMALLKLLAQQKGGVSPSGEGDQPLPIFSDQSPDEVQDTLDDIMDTVESLSDTELDMVDPSGEGHELDQERDGQRSGSGGLQALKIAEKMKAGSYERQILEIARMLQQFTQLDVKKQNNELADPSADEIRYRPIRHLGELSKLTANEWAKYGYLPKAYFNYLALTHGLTVRERFRREERKQAILVLVDGSGSMQGDKHTKATGVVMNRLLAVVEGDAEVYLGVFDTSLTIVGEAKTPTEARDLIKKFREGNFKGGGTNIATAIRQGHNYLQKKIADGELLWRPEIVVLTDEDSSIEGLSAAEVPDTRVHGFAMSVSNPGLVKFCQSTGGIGIERF